MHVMDEGHTTNIITYGEMSEHGSMKGVDPSHQGQGLFGKDSDPVWNILLNIQYIFISGPCRYLRSRYHFCLMHLTLILMIYMTLS